MAYLTILTKKPSLLFVHAYFLPIFHFGIHKSVGQVGGVHCLGKSPIFWHVSPLDRLLEDMKLFITLVSFIFLCVCVNVAGNPLSARPFLHSSNFHKLPIVFSQQLLQMFIISLAHINTSCLPRTIFQQIHCKCCQGQLNIL